MFTPGSQPPPPRPFPCANPPPPPPALPSPRSKASLMGMACPPPTYVARTQAHTMTRAVFARRGTYCVAVDLLIASAV